jgi:hypothetical protein
METAMFAETLDNFQNSKPLFPETERLYGTQAAKTLRQGLFYRSLSIVRKLFKTITFVKLLLLPYSIDR